MTAEDKLVEEVADALREHAHKQGVVRSWKDYAAVAIPIMAGHCAEVAREMTPDLPTHPSWDTGISVGHAIATALESIGKGRG
ncbi:hypothetical protein [Rhizorhabdus histidinilytica]|uniref:hypothetical protein n=1 Tax=Rhizorhabdus histidinilytica TaxID=439228 RepID=UPI00321FEFDD